MFILQFTNVPEWSGKGLLMAQVVLHEGSNAITMYTNTMSTTRFGARVTQGIENADGTAHFAGDSVVLPNGMKTPRIKAVFKLNNDADSLHSSQGNSRHGSSVDHRARQPRGCSQRSWARVCSDR